MPLRRLSWPDAVAGVRSNPYAAWPAGDEPDTNRLKPMCRPSFLPTFTFEYGEKIFSIGSGFARSVERALAARGFDAVTTRFRWPDSWLDGVGGSALDIDGIASIANELRWALDPASPFDPDMNVVEVSPDRWVDLHFAHGRPTSREIVLARRAGIADVMRRAKECRVVIITLGSGEQWFDTATGLYLNGAPPSSIAERLCDRFEVHLQSFAEAMAAMHSALSTLRKFCRRDQKIILAVSPVPPAVTSLGQDAIVTNVYSKSLLRTAAEHAAAPNKNIDYFPFYESAIFSGDAFAWQEDQRTVQDGLVAENVERMIEAYRPGSVVPDETKIAIDLKRAEEELSERNAVAAMAILEPIRAAAATHAEFATVYAKACIKLGRIEDAARVVANFPGAADDWRREILMAKVRLAKGDAEGAVAALTRLAETETRRRGVLSVIVDAYVEAERYSDALVAARKWMAAEPRSIEPIKRVAAIHVKLQDTASAEAAFKFGTEQGNATTSFFIDYAEFLIDQKRLGEAAALLKQCEPETKALQSRLDRLRVLLPGAWEDFRHSSEQSPRVGAIRIEDKSVELPGKIYGKSCSGGYAFGMHKAGSTMLTTALRRVARRAGIKHVNFQSVAGRCRHLAGHHGTRRRGAIRRGRMAEPAGRVVHGLAPLSAG